MALLRFTTDRDDFMLRADGDARRAQAGNLGEYSCFYYACIREEHRIVEGIVNGKGEDAVAHTLVTMPPEAGVTVSHS